MFDFLTHKLSEQVMAISLYYRDKVSEMWQLFGSGSCEMSDETRNSTKA